MYPAIEPFDNGGLEVDSGHQLYYEQCGDPTGEPVVFIHGGPGAGCSPNDRCFFDPAHFRIVLLDQRGAGRSRPLGELRANTTDHLIADLERLRERLEIERWHVFGGSWGSTLGLAYAQTHTERCRSLVLRGIWLFRERDLNWWLYQLRWFKPELWREFVEPVPPDQRNDLIEAYWRLLNGSDRDAALAAAHRWARYEIHSCTLLPNPEFAARFESDDAAWALARLECHYFRSGHFEPEDLLLQRIDRIRAIPAVIVHGRYDLVCPVAIADELHRHWPEASYVVVEDAGHSSSEPGIARELVAATDRIRDTGSPELATGDG